MKNIKKTLAILLLSLIPLTASAQFTVPQGGTGRNSFLTGSIPFMASEPLRFSTSSGFQWDNILSRLTATNASTTALTATTLCLSSDCRTLWPSGSTTTINGVSGPTFLFNTGGTGGTALSYSTSTGTVTLNLSTSTLASLGIATGTNPWDKSGTNVFLKAITDLVGIGSSTPSAKLAVTGNGGTGDILALASSTNSRLLTFKSTGRLGLGTASPTALVDLIGPDASTVPLRIQNPAAQSNYSLLIEDPDGTDVLNHNTYGGTASVLQVMSTSSKYFQMESYEVDNNYFSAAGAPFSIRTIGQYPIIFYTNTSTGRAHLSDFSGHFIVGTLANATNGDARIHSIWDSGPQLRLGTDFANTAYMDARVGSTGTTTFDAFGTAGGSFTFSDPVTLSSSSAPLIANDSVGSVGSVLVSRGGGVSPQWVATSTLGLGTGSTQYWALDSGGLKVSTSTDFAKAAYFIATSTTATSTFANNVQIKNNLIREHNAGFLDIQRQVTDGDYTLVRIRSPRTTSGPSKESTLSLVNDKSGDNSGVNEEFIDFYNENYADSAQWGLREAYSGTGSAKPFVLGFWNTTGSKDAGNALIILPTKAIGMGMTATSTVATSTILHIASSTVTYLQKWDAAPGTNLGVFTSTGRLGVGTSSPASTVDVWGNFRVGTSSAPILFANSGTRRIGIGTSTPLATLHIYENDGTGASPSLYMGGNAGGDTDYSMWRQSDNDSVDDDFFQFGRGLVGTNPIMTFDNQLRVGIGTTTPAALLHLATTSSPQLRLGYNGAQYLNNSVSSTGGLTWDMIGTTPKYDWNISGTNRMTLSNLGYLGIGSSTPVAPFVVASSTNNSLNLKYDPSATNTPTMYVGRTGVQGQIILQDTDGAGCTIITTLNGSVNGNITTCPAD